MARSMKMMMAAATVALLAGSAASAKVIYVNGPLATGTNTGASWANAFRGPTTSLQAALAAAQYGDEVWVATGTYKPAAAGGARSSTFQLKNGVAVYGGFAGNETARSQRTVSGSPNTILDGDLAGNSPTTRSDDAFHVVTADGGVNSTTVLDGFLVRFGFASDAAGAGNNAAGGGMIIGNRTTGYGSPTVANCVFSNNLASPTGPGRGGAVYVRGLPIFTSCRFTGNTANNDNGSGGAMYIDGDGSVATVIACQFDANQSGTFGGAISLNSGVLQMYNTLVNGNTTGTSNGNQQPLGGGVYLAVNSAGSALISNSTITGNRARPDGQGQFGSNGGGVYSESGTTTVQNSILWANIRDAGSGDTSDQGAQLGGGFVAGAGVSFNVIQNLTGFAGQSNSAADPLFVNAGAGNYTLNANSPAVDSGNNALQPAGLNRDRGGLTRRMDDAATSNTGSGSAPFVDRGAFERAGSAANGPSNIIYVNATLASGANDGSSWANAFRNGRTALPAALAAAKYGDEVWVARGTYYTGAVGSPRLTSFRLVNGVKVFGGFIGGETARSQRQIDPASTILDGDVSGDATQSNNVYSVVLANRVNGETALDGFRVQGGFANDSSGNSLLGEGGGVRIGNRAGAGATTYRGDLTVANCAFLGNSAPASGNGLGGAVSVAGAPTFTNCSFTNNLTPNNSSNGGAIGIDGDGSNVVIDRCAFTGNQAGVAGGAVASTNAAAVTITSSLFVGNTAGVSNSNAMPLGGAVYAGTQGGRVNIVNATIYNNRTRPDGQSQFGSSGAGVYSEVGTTTVSSTLLWNNARGTSGVATTTDQQAQLGGNYAPAGVNYSSYQGFSSAFGGLGNNGSDPFFNNPGAGDFRLSSGSPAVDSGDNTAAPTAPGLDLLARARFVDVAGVPDTGRGASPIIDRGAVETQRCRADFNGDGDINANDISAYLNAWYLDNVSGTLVADFNGDGETNANDISVFLNAWYQGVNDNGIC